MSVILSVRSWGAIATLSIALISGRSAIAQTTDTATTKATAPQDRKAVDGSIEPVADTTAATSDGHRFQSGTETLNTNTVTPETTSTANLAKAIEAAAPRRWFGEFYSETYTSKTDFENGHGTPRLDSYAGVKYDFGNSRALSVRQNFDYTGALGSGAGDFHIQDLAINYTDGKLATFAGDGAIIFIGRLYLPTGENSRNITKREGAERAYFLAAKSFGKLDLTYVLMGQVANWTQDSYQSVDAKGVVTDNQNKWLAMVNEVDVFYNITPKVAVGFLVGDDYYRNRPVAGQYDVASDVYLQPTLQLTPFKDVVLQAAIYDNPNIYNPKVDFAFMRDEDLSVYFNLAATL